MKRLFLLVASVLGTLMLTSSVHATLLFTVNSGNTTTISQFAVTGTTGTYDIQGDLVDDGVGTLKLTNLYIRATSPGGASDAIYFMSDTAALPAGTTGTGSTTVTGSWTHSTTGFSSTPTSVTGGEFSVLGFTSGVLSWNGLNWLGAGAGFDLPNYSAMGGSGYAYAYPTSSGPIEPVVISSTSESFAQIYTNNDAYGNGELFFSHPFGSIDLTAGLAGALNFTLANDGDGLYFPGSIEIFATSAVPEPTSLLLLGSGLAGIVALKHRERK